MKPVLIAAKGKQRGTLIPVSSDLFLVGTDRICQLRANHPSLGGQHCAITVNERSVSIRDLASGHPTIVNGEEIPPGDEWPLHAGDRLTIGPLEFMVQFQEAKLSHKDTEEWALRSLDMTANKGLPVDEEVEDYTTPAQAAASILGKMDGNRGVIKGRLRLMKEETAVVVRFNDGNLVEDSEVALVKKELYQHVEKLNDRVLLDFKNVKRMSSAAVKVMFELNGWIRARGGTMAMCHLNSEVQGIFKTLSFDNVPVFPDKDMALRKKW